MQERDKTIDVLKRLKAQEDKPLPELYKKQEKRKEEPVKIVNLPQRKIESLMQKIEEIRRKMRVGNQGYFNLYYDLKNAEQEFLKEASIIKDKNFQIPQTTMQRVNNMVSSIRQSTGEKK